MKQNADVAKPSEVDTMLGAFFSGKDASEKGNTAEATPPADGPAPKSDEAIPAIPTASPTGETIETLKAEMAISAQQVKDLSAALEEAQRALLDQNSETWKHKYDALNGKMKKQGPEMKIRIKELEDELDAVKAAKPGTEVKPPIIAESDKKRGESWGVDPDEISSFRQEIIDQVMASIPKTPTAKAKEVATDTELADDTEIPAPPTKTPPVPVQDHATKAFLALVDFKAKGWQDIRQKPEFASFCNTRPGGDYGPTYLDYLKDAAEKLDASMTARVYNDFLKTVKPAVSTEEKPSREAADSRSKGGDGAPVAAETWTPEKIEKFSNDVNAGKIKRGSPEYLQLKASYDKWLSNIKVAG